MLRRTSRQVAGAEVPVTIQGHAANCQPDFAAPACRRSNWWLQAPLFATKPWPLWDGWGKRRAASRRSPGEPGVLPSLHLPGRATKLGPRLPPWSRGMSGLLTSVSEAEGLPMSWDVDTNLQATSPRVQESTSPRVHEFIPPPARHNSPGRPLGPRPPRKRLVPPAAAVCPVVLRESHKLA